jgi:hypothetical protein
MFHVKHRSCPTSSCHSSEPHGRRRATRSRLSAVARLDEQSRQRREGLWSVRRTPAKFLAIAAFLAGATSGLDAGADPQVNAGLRTGVAGVGDNAWWDRTRFHLGAHGDVMLGRSKNADFGLGPYAEIFTNWGDLQLGAGASAHLPIHSVLPIVLSAGAYGRKNPNDGWEPGVSAELFWGSRSYNYEAPYVMVGGLVVGLRQGLGDSKERSIIIAAHIDAGLLSAPFVLLYEAIRGGPPK